jgi:hypothetical protein
MDEDAVIEELEELARGFGIEIRYEPISIEEETINVIGGFCRLRGEPLLIINSKATIKDRIKALAEGLNEFDLDAIYIRPVIREVLDNARRHRSEPFAITEVNQ